MPLLLLLPLLPDESVLVHRPDGLQQDGRLVRLRRARLRVSRPRAQVPWGETELGAAPLQESPLPGWHLGQALLLRLPPTPDGRLLLPAPG